MWLCVITCALSAVEKEALPVIPEGVDNLFVNDWKVEWGEGISLDPANPVNGQDSLALGRWTQVYGPDIEVEPGYRYFFSAMCKIENFMFIKTDYGFGFGLEQIKANGDRNGNWYDMYAYGIYNEGDQDWTYQAASWIPKDTTKFLRPALLVKADPGSKAWIGDFKIWKEPLAKKETFTLSNVIENGKVGIIYDVDITPFGYTLQGVDGKRVEFGTLARASKEAAKELAASIKIQAPSTILSPIGKLDGGTVDASIAVLAKELNNGTLNVELRLLNSDNQIVKAVTLGTVKDDSNEWITLRENINYEEISKEIVSAQFAITFTGVAKAVCYIDDLQAQIKQPVAGIPARTMNRAQAKVSVDAANTGAVFQNPLDSYDHHVADRVYSYTVGTAGPHLEGDNRWFESRGRLGIRYVRIHSFFESNGRLEYYPVAERPDINFHSANGETGVVFGMWRTDDEDKPFPPIAQMVDGKLVTDFAVCKYLLDKAILRGGVRPIIDLAPVPRCLAMDNDPHKPPYDMQLWEEFIERFFRFLVDNYGAEEVMKWKFETVNEPSTQHTFHGASRETVVKDFIEMQDHTIAGAQKVLPEVFIAGPSGPPGDFFIPMLKHAAEGKNYATNKIGDTKIDAISYHGYMGATPTDLSWRQSEEQVFGMMRYRDYYEQLTGKRIEVWNTEFAAIYLEVTPKNPSDGAYENHIQAVATLHMTNFSYRAGVSRMVFFYHSPTYFAPVRGDHNFSKAPNQKDTSEFLGEPTVRTFHGVFKPVTRIMQLLSWMNDGLLLNPQVDNEPIYAIGVRQNDEVKLLLYSYDLDPTQSYDTTVTVEVDNLAPETKYEVVRYELNKEKANSWALAQKYNVTQKMCEDDITWVDRLNDESEFVPEELGVITTDASGKLNTVISMPTISASLLEFKPVK